MLLLFSCSHKSIYEDVDSMNSSFRIKLDSNIVKFELCNLTDDKTLLYMNQHTLIYESSGKVIASSPLLSDITNGPHKLELPPKMKIERSLDLDNAHSFSFKYVEDKDIPEFAEVYFKIGQLKSQKIKIRSKDLIKSFIRHVGVKSEQ